MGELKRTPSESKELMEKASGEMLEDQGEDRVESDQRRAAEWIRHRGFQQQEG